MNIIRGYRIERIAHIVDIKNLYLPDKFIPDVNFPVLPVYKSCDLLNQQLCQKPKLNDPKHHIESRIKPKENDTIVISKNEKEQGNCSTFNMADI